MLLHADQDRALAYLASCLDQVNSFGDILQLVIVELIYKVSQAGAISYLKSYIPKGGTTIQNFVSKL